MDDDELFIVKDPHNLYSIARINALLNMAAHQGHPMERGSYLEHMTVRQIDALVHGKMDA